MVGDELRMQQHVAVDEDQVVRRVGGDGEIAQAGEAESLVRLGHGAHRHGGARDEAGDHVARGGARAVVGDDDLGGRGALARDAVEHGGERVGALVGA